MQGNIDFNRLVIEIRDFAGFRKKADIGVVQQALSKAFPSEHVNGDDTAYIQTELGYQLFAIEGFVQEFVARDPWFAGWCAVMVNVSDVAAMGGKPIAVTNALWSSSNADAKIIIDGMVAASNRYRVPIVGGHTNLNDQSAYLAASILGWADSIVDSFSAQPEHDIIAAIDLRGEYRAPFLNWNAATNASSEQLLGDLALLPLVASRGLASGLKDISQAGVLGTLVMLCECSQVGATIDIQRIPIPPCVSYVDWLKSFPSFGFVLTCPKQNTNSIVELFGRRGIAAQKIGEITSSKKVVCEYGDESALFWDFKTTPLMCFS